MESKKECYFCGKASTSSEHVPPKNLFPTDPKYRYNLITVPSCDEHNSKKSDLDNRMLIFFSGVNKKVFYEKDFKCLMDKTIRAMMRDIKLFNGMTDDAKFFRKKDKGLSLIANNPSNTEVKINYDDHKFYQECILRGIYYKTYNQPWNGEVFIIPKSLFGFEENFNDLAFAFGIDEFEDWTLKNSRKLSKNKVFQCKSLDLQEIKIIGVCIYLEYYFYGIFCDTTTLQKVKNLFSPQSVVRVFNAS